MVTSDFNPVRSGVAVAGTRTRGPHAPLPAGAEAGFALA
jgi:hypothetical protein